MKMNYPDDYKCEIVISKFNKILDLGVLNLVDSIMVLLIVLPNK